MPRRYDLMVTVNTSRRSVLVVGGGAVGERKTGTLLDGGSAVTLISPDVTPGLEAWIHEGRLQWQSRKVRREDFSPGLLVVLALSVAETRQILPLVRRAGSLCNCCSLPEEGDWAFPAQFTSRGVLFGVGTGGQNPSLAARWKRKLKKMIEEAYP